MAVFESLLLLLSGSLALLLVARRYGLPYPAMLAMAGVAAAFLPGAPKLEIDPPLALAIFIVPALLESAYGSSPRALLRDWVALTSLVVVAVLLTTVAVAWVGWRFGGMPIAAAVTLGAIVAPPDAVAAATVLQRFRLPRRAVFLLNGESLLNDAVALLLFGAATTAAMTPDAEVGSTALELLLSVPAGAALGWLAFRLHSRIAPAFAGTLSSTILEFVSGFGSWVIASHLGWSAIITLVAFGMAASGHVPSRSTPRDRVHSYSIWNTAAFALNVVAFSMMGLQTREVLGRLSAPEVAHALQFAGMILATVMGVRLGWVFLHGLLARAIQKVAGPKHHIRIPPRRASVLIGWCGMRGLVTMATALSLPVNFPERDLISLAATVVVMGTLVVQGLTIGPLIRLLNIAPDATVDTELKEARGSLAKVAVAALSNASGPCADDLRDEYRSKASGSTDNPSRDRGTERDALRRVAIHAQRGALEAMRKSGGMDEAIYHRLVAELDWAELAAAPAAEGKLEGV